MPARKIKVTATKFRKKSLVLSKESVERLKMIISSGFGESFNAKVKVNGQEFFLKQRKDKRAEIPASVVKRAHLKSGKFTVELTNIKKGDFMKERRTFGIARKKSDIISRFWLTPIYEVDQGEVVASIYRDIYVKAQKSVAFYFRLLFIVQNRDGELYAFVRTFPETDSSIIDNEELAITMVRRFVEEVFDEMFDMMNRKSMYIEQIYFAKYTVYGENLIKEKVRMRA